MLAMMRSKPLCSGILVTALCAATLLAAALCTSRALAQEDTERSSRDLEAQSLFEAGTIAFSDGRYRDALQHFRGAHELSQRPEMLFNIGAAAERLRRDAEALEAYETFLSEVPDSDQRRQVEARIEILRDSLAGSSADEHNDDEHSDASGRNYTMAWVSGAATLVFVGVGTTGRIAGNQAYDDLLTTCRAGCTEAAIDASPVRRWDRLTIASFSLGALAAVGTVLALAFAPKNNTAPVVRIGPAHISLQGQF